MASWWMIPVVLAVLFAYVDVWYFTRFFFLGLRIKMKSKSKGGKRERAQELLEPYDINGIVLPSDLDCMLHMNNSKYLREMDYGRIGMAMERAIDGAIKANGGSIALVAHSVRYRRSLQLFQRFLLRTKVVCWDDEALYFEQRMMRSSDGFVCAINIAKFVLRGTTMPAVVKTLLGESLESPPFPLAVAHWCESNTASSKSLLEERIRS